MRSALTVSTAALLAVAGSSLAQASGPSARPLVSPWQGAYVGGHIGYGWGDSTADCTAHCTPDSTSFSTEGALGGLQIGYNHVINGLLFGVEGDFSFTGIEGDGTFGGKNVDSELPWMATLRLRAGVPIHNDAVVFVTGGAAFAQWDDSFKFIANKEEWSDIYTGYALGGGFERKLSPNVSFKIEYLYADFGSDTKRDGDFKIDFDHEVHTVRFGLNYKLW